MQTTPIFCKHRYPRNPWGGHLPPPRHPNDVPVCKYIPQNTNCSFFNRERHLEKYIVYFLRVLTYVFDCSMNTYRINNILFSDDYFTINQITMEPILRKILIIKMWDTTMIHSAYNPFKHGGTYLAPPSSSLTFITSSITTSHSRSNNRSYFLFPKISFPKPTVRLLVSSSCLLV